MRDMKGFFNWDASGEIQFFEKTVQQTGFIEIARPEYSFRRKHFEEFLQCQQSSLIRPTCANRPELLISSKNLAAKAAHFKFKVVQSS